MSNKETATYTKSFPSDPELLPDIENFVISHTAEAKLDKKKINDLSLSIAEAASNAIKHGNKSDINKKVKVTVKIYTDKIVISIKDEGTGFVLKDVPDPTLPENLLKDSGRGIYIMKTFLDKVEFNFTPSGTEVVLTMNFNKK